MARQTPFCAEAIFSIIVPFSEGCHLAIIQNSGDITGSGSGDDVGGSEGPETVPPGSDLHTVDFEYRGGIDGATGQALAKRFNIFMYGRSDKTGNAAGTPESPLSSGLPRFQPNARPAVPNKGGPSNAQVKNPAVSNAAKSTTGSGLNVWLGEFDIVDFPNVGSETDDISQDTTFEGMIQLLT